MNYRNSEMKLDQLIGYLNDEKINLVPPFQRGHVWKLPTRQKLIKNIVEGKPIPAIFLYKEASGSKYSYNILDGKQRLESLILFIGSERSDISINHADKYFFGDRHKKFANFEVDIDGSPASFKTLDEEMVRDFREYAIPTIEISLTDQTSLDEIIELFIDINQQGVKVNRFDIVKAMGKNKLLADTFDLVAEKQQRKQDIFYRQKRNDFTRVLDNLQIIANLKDANSRVDRMWERLLEIVLFCRTDKHRPPVQILKSFIGGGDGDKSKITSAENNQLRQLFGFLKESYSLTNLGSTKLAVDQTHFYTMVTSIITGRLMEVYSNEDLKRKLLSFAAILEGKATMTKDKKVANSIKTYQDLSTKQTTHVGRRTERHTRFMEAIEAL